jgi:hypothetical protein
MEYADQCKPVLKTLRDFDVDPLTPVYVLALRVEKASDRGSTALRTAYDAWISSLAPLR